MIYKVEFSLEQFCIEPCYSKHAPDFFIVTILLINQDLEIRIFWNLQTNGVVFTPVPLIFVFFFIFK